MTTVVDPSGTPSVTYNRSGVAIVDLVGGDFSGGGNSGTAVPHVCGVMVAMVSTSRVSGVTHVGVTLSDDSEIGDIVEVYSVPDGTFLGATVFPPVGDSIGTLVASSGTNTASGLGVSPISGVILRKVSATKWMPVGAAA